MNQFIIIPTSLAIAILSLCGPVLGEGTKEAFIDKSGEIRFFTPYRLVFPERFSYGLAAVQNGKLVGFINKSGKVEIKPKYREAQQFTEGLAAVKTKSGKWGFIDEKGSFVIKPQYDDCAPFFEGFAQVKKHDSVNYINHQGQLISENWYQLGGKFSNGLAPIKVQNKWGYIDTSGKTVIPPRFDRARNFSGGRAFVFQNNKCLLIDTMGQKVTEFDDDIVVGDFSEGKAAMMNPSKLVKYWYVGDNGKPSTSKKYYAEANDFHEGIAWVREVGARGCINKDEEKIIDFKYIDSLNFSEGLAAASLDGKWGYIDPKGQWVIPPKFESASDFKEGLALVRLSSVKDRTKLLRSSK